MAGLSFAIASSVFAADTQPSTPGLLTFPNVRVETAPQPAAATTQTANGMRAFVDPTTRRLRQLTTEDAAQLEAAGKPKVTARAPRARTQSTAAVSDPQPTIYKDDGTVGMELSVEHEVYQVAHKAKDGIALGEYTGKTAAERAVKSSSGSKQEGSHAR